MCAFARSAFPCSELTLIDGEMRHDLMGAREVPVLETNLTEDEARELVLFFDRIGSMASYSPSLTLELVQAVERNNSALADLARQMGAEAEIKGLMDENGATRSQPAGRTNRAAGKEKEPQPIKAVIAVQDLQVVEKALALTGERNRGEALAQICRMFLNSMEKS